MIKKMEPKDYVPCFLCNLKVHYYVPEPDKSTPHLSSVVLVDSFNSIIPSTSRSSTSSCQVVYMYGSLTDVDVLFQIVVVPQTKRLDTPVAPETVMFFSGCRTLVVTCYSAVWCSSECNLLDRSTRNNTTTRLE
jgi:hypothetical protein